MSEVRALTASDAPPRGAEGGRDACSVTTWIPAVLVREMLGDAQHHAPAETGGGYWASDDVVVVTAIVDGGPLAVRSPEGFIPDAAHQATRIADLYEDSGRVDTYLGDWHSHPEGSVSLSWTDRRTIRRISRHRPARCPVPLMIVVGGVDCAAVCGVDPDGGDVWELACWSFDRRSTPRLARTTLQVDTRDGATRQ